MSKKHALLSPSSASRWLNCTPSAVLESKLPERSSSYADEGTLAHTMAELKLKRYFNLISEIDYQNEMIEVEQNKYWNEAMVDHIDAYVAFVIERYNDHQEAAIFLEQQINISQYVPESFGHVDVNIVGHNILDVIDLKYGQGVAVSAVNNKQGMLYALGSYHEFQYMSTIEVVRITIYQPRIGNYSTHEIGIAELLKWAEEEVKPKAEIAYQGKGEKVAGEWCMFCKVKARCRTFAEAQLKVAKVEFSDLEKDTKITTGSDDLTDEEITNIVLKASEFKSWINAIEEYALKEAIVNKKKWPGLKLVAGRSIRKYTDELKIIEVLQKKKFELDQITSRKILPITQMEKLLGPEKFTKLLSKYVIKPQGSLTLVSISDKRPEFNSLEAAQNDFN